MSNHEPNNGHLLEMPDHLGGSLQGLIPGSVAHWLCSLGANDIISLDLCFLTYNMQLIIPPSQTSAR